MHHRRPSWPCPTSSRSTSRPRRRSSATSPGATPSRACGAARRAACRRTTGFAIDVPRGLEALAEADTVLVPGLRPAHWPPPAAVLDALRAAHARGARIASICTGAFVLAARRPARRPPRHDALGPRRAARRALSRRSPSIPACSTSTRATCSPRPASPRASTSACTSCAATTAPRWPTPSRGGSSSPRTATAARRSSSSTPLPAAPASAASRPRAPGRWSACASRSRWRRWRATPRAASAPSRGASAPRRAPPRCSGCCAQRVLHARRLLESTDLPVEDVADHAGFGTATSLRSHFRRATATTPARVSPQLQG